LVFGSTYPTISWSKLTAQETDSTSRHIDLSSLRDVRLELLQFKGRIARYIQFTGGVAMKDFL